VSVNAVTPPAPARTRCVGGELWLKKDNAPIRDDLLRAIDQHAADPIAAPTFDLLPHDHDARSRPALFRPALTAPRV